MWDRPRLGRKSVGPVVSFELFCVVIPRLSSYRGAGGEGAGGWRRAGVPGRRLEWVAKCHHWRREI